MTLYGRFRRLKLAPAALGMERRGENTPYFCTPVGAEIIGWAGVDGIHYCFIRRFGEMVFAVDPMNDPGNHVYPLARNFEDFLRLLLSCGDAGCIQQAHAWDAAAFARYQQENPRSEAQTAALDKLAKTFRLTPMPDPLGYIRAVYDEFDRSQIKFRPDYYEWVPAEPQEPKKPAWRVWYHGSFWTEKGQGRPGKRIDFDRSYVWGADEVRIPAVYSCAEGMVVDVCIGVDARRIRAYLDQWSALTADESRLSQEQREQLEYLNPLHIEFHLEAEVNGRALRQKFACSQGWLPEHALPEGYENDRRTRWTLEEYGLDPQMGWSIHRVSLPWATTRRPELRSLMLTLRPDRVSLPGAHFRVTGVGETVQLTHPRTGVTHTLTVTELEPQTLPDHAFRDPDTDYPTHCSAMSFTLTPDLPRGALQVQDCARGDRPRRKPKPGFAPTAVNDAVVGIIGGADGPTALVYGVPDRPTTHAAISSLYFEPPGPIEWRIIWREATREPLTRVLL